MRKENIMSKTELELKPCPFCGGEANMTFIFVLDLKWSAPFAGAKQRFLTVTETR